DDEAAWIFADDPASGVGLGDGVGLGSSLGFAKNHLGGEGAPITLAGAPPAMEISSRRGVALGFGGQIPASETKISTLFGVDRGLWPGAKISIHGMVLPESKIAFAEKDRHHESTVKTSTPLPPVGSLIEGEGTRLDSGEVDLTQIFVKNP